jgi:hypothetical protein
MERSVSLLGEKIGFGKKPFYGYRKHRILRLDASLLKATR